eukprot:gene23490-biopygen4336
MTFGRFYETGSYSILPVVHTSGWAFRNKPHVPSYLLRFEVCLNWHDGSTIFRSPVAAFAVAYPAAALKGARHTARAALHDKRRDAAPARGCVGQRIVPQTTVIPLHYSAIRGNPPSAAAKRGGVPRYGRILKKIRRASRAGFSYFLKTLYTGLGPHLATQTLSPARNTFCFQQHVPPPTPTSWGLNTGKPRGSWGVEPGMAGKVGVICHASAPL